MYPLLLDLKKGTTFTTFIDDGKALYSNDLLIMKVRGIEMICLPNFKIFVGKLFDPQVVSNTFVSIDFIDPHS